MPRNEILQVLNEAAGEQPFENTRAIQPAKDPASTVQAGLVETESSGDPNAVSPKGAIGLWQIMPDTGREIAEELGEEFDPEMLKDPKTSERYGKYYLNKMIKRYGGDVRFGLAAFHAGPQRADKLYADYLDAGEYNIPRALPYWDGEVDEQGNPIEGTGTFTADYVQRIIDRSEYRPQISKRDEIQAVLENAQTRGPMPKRQGPWVLPVSAYKDEISPPPKGVPRVREGVAKDASWLDVAFATGRSGWQQLGGQVAASMGRSMEAGAQRRIKEIEEGGKYGEKPLDPFTGYPIKKEVAERHGKLGEAIREEGKKFAKGVPEKQKKIAEEAGTGRMIPSNFLSMEQWDETAKTWIALTGQTSSYMAMASIPFVGTPMVMAAMGEQFYDTAEEVGIPADKIPKYANAYGIAAGLIEKAQAVGRIRGIKKAAGTATSKVLRNATVKNVLVALGENVSEGMEEIAQYGLEAFLMKRLIKEAREEDKNWTPKTPEPEYGWKEAFKQFSAGGGVSVLFRGSGLALGEAGRAIDKPITEARRKKEMREAGIVRGEGFYMSAPHPEDELQGIAQYIRDLRKGRDIAAKMEETPEPQDRAPGFVKTAQKPPEAPRGLPAPEEGEAIAKEQKPPEEPVQPTGEPPRDFLGQTEWLRESHDTPPGRRALAKELGISEERATALIRSTYTKDELKGRYEPQERTSREERREQVMKGMFEEDQEKGFVLVPAFEEQVRNDFSEKPTKNQVSEKYGISREQAGKVIRSIYGGDLENAVKKRYKEKPTRKQVMQAFRVKGERADQAIATIWPEEKAEPKGLPEPERAEIPGTEEDEAKGQRLAEKHANWKFDGIQIGVQRKGGKRVEPSIQLTRTVKGEETTIQLPTNLSEEEMDQRIEGKENEYSDIKKAKALDVFRRKQEERRKKALGMTGIIKKYNLGEPIVYSDEYKNSAPDQRREMLKKKSAELLNLLKTELNDRDRIYVQDMQREVRRSMRHPDIRTETAKVKTEADRRNIERIKNADFESRVRETVNEDIKQIISGLNNDELRALLNFDYDDEAINDARRIIEENDQDGEVTDKIRGDVAERLLQGVKPKDIVDEAQYYAEQGMDVPEGAFDESFEFGKNVEPPAEPPPATPEDRKAKALEVFKKKREQRYTEKTGDIFEGTEAEDTRTEGQKAIDEESRRRTEAAPEQEGTAGLPMFSEEERLANATKQEKLDIFTPEKKPPETPIKEQKQPPKSEISRKKASDALKRASENSIKLLKSFEEPDPNKLYSIGTRQAELAFDVVSDLVEAGYYEFKAIVQKIAEIVGEGAKNASFQEAIEDAYDAYTQVDASMGKRTTAFSEEVKNVERPGKEEPKGREPEPPPEPEGEGGTGGVLPEEGEGGGGVPAESGGKGDEVGRGDGTDTGELSDVSGEAQRGRTDGRGNYRITEADQLGAGSQQVKYRDNVEAIRILKKIENEKRLATPEEQKILVRYVGWGPVKFAFAHGSRERAELQELLTADEFRAADQSALNAHYTSPEVIIGIWNAVRRMGYNGGPTMEPAIGVGHFYGLRPDIPISMHGIEKDSLSARIAKQLYQTANIRNQAYEDVRLSGNHYNLIISNVPFADIKPVESKRAQTPGLKRGKYSLHNFYFLKSLHGVREGGLIAFVTTHYTMDSTKNKNVRYEIAQSADFVGAIRLPKTAFKGMANTEVVTDVIFLKKRAPGQKMSELTRQFIGTEQREFPNKQGKMVRHSVSKYFLENPDMVIGEHSARGTMYGPDEYTVEFMGNPEEYGEAYRNAIDALPANIVKYVDKTTAEMEEALSRFDPDNMQPGQFALDSVTGDVYQKNEETGKIVRVNLYGESLARLKGQISIKDTARRIFALQAAGKEQEANENLARLNREYDDYVKKWGRLNELNNKRVYAQDPERDFLLALEDVREEKAPNGKTRKVYSKSGFFTGKVFVRPEIPTEVNSLTDAIYASRFKYGKMNLDYMAEVYGVDKQSMIEEMLDGALVYEDAQSFLDQEHGDPVYVAYDEYLSGNVRKKLYAAREAARANPRFEKNVEALEKVVPPDIPATQIHMQMGNPVVSQEDMYEFVSGLLDDVRDSAIEVWYSKPLGKWTVAITDPSYYRTASTQQTWGTEKANAIYILNSLLRGQKPIVKKPGPTVINPKTGEPEVKMVLDEIETERAQQKADAIRERFFQWIWADPDRAGRIVKDYNDRNNCMVDRDWVHPLLAKNSNAKVFFPGSAFPLPAREHQANGVYRTINSKNTMLAHAVGSGKTNTALWSCMEKKRLGMCKKSMVVIPNHMVEQWSRDAYRAYPNAKILVSRTKNFNPSSRRQFLNRVATGDWDIVIMRYSHFEMLPTSPDFYRDFSENQIDMYEDEIERLKAVSKSGRERNQLRARIERIRSKIRRLEREKAAGVLFFDQMGVDNLVVDEADEFKNLEYVTTLNNVRGMGQPQGSGRAFDMLSKVRFIQSIDGGVTFMTGTPISNTLVEAYSMMRFLQPEILANSGYETFDAWRSQYASHETRAELNNTGTGYTMVTRFSRVVNLPELFRNLRQAWDIRTTKYLRDKDILVPGKNLPMVHAEYIQAPSTPDLKSYLTFLEMREESIKLRGKPEKGADIVLNIIGDGKKAAVDMRMIHPSVEESPESKLNLVVDKIYENWKASSDDRSTSAVFLDMYRTLDVGRMGGISVDEEEPTIGAGQKKVMFNAYEVMRRKLIEKGIPIEEIAFIQEHKTEAQKIKLFDAINDGRVRIIFGTTGSMGAGTNIQKRLKYMYHMDAPWRPRDIEQRNGRIVRPDNLNDDVYVYYSSTKGSLDAGIWALLKTKAELIEKMMGGEEIPRELEEDYYESAQQLAIDDPKLKELMVQRDKLTKAKRARDAFTVEQSRAKSDLHNAQQDERSARDYVRKLKEDKAQLPDEPKGDKFTMTVDGKEYTKPGDAGKAIYEIASEMEKAGDKKIKKIGTFAGLPISIRVGYTHGDGSQVAVTFFAKAKNHEYSTWDYLREKTGVDLPSLQKQPHKPVLGVRSILYDGIDRKIDSTEKRMESYIQKKAAAQNILKKGDEFSEIIPELEARVNELQEEVNREAQQRPPEPPGRYDWEYLTGRSIEQEVKDRRMAPREEIVENPPEDMESEEGGDIKPPLPDIEPQQEAPPPQKPPETSPSSAAEVQKMSMASAGKRRSGLPMAIPSSLDVADAISWNAGASKEKGYLTAWDTFYWKWVDAASPIVKMDDILRNMKLPEDQMEYVREKLDYAINRTRASGGIAAQYMEDNLQPIITELTKGLSPKKKGAIARELSKYLVAKRAAWRFDNDSTFAYNEAALSEERCKNFVYLVESGNHPNSEKIQQAAEKIWAYGKKLMKIKLDAGVIDDDLYDQLDEPNYVPFYRDLSKKSRSAIKTPAGVRFTAITTGISRIKGSRSGHKVIDPLQLLRAQTTETITNANRVTVAQGIIEVAEKYPTVFGGMVEELPQRWMRVGTIEHRIVVDKMLRDQLKEVVDRLGGIVEHRARMRKNAGEFSSMDDTIRLLFGATEGVMAHELGHLMDKRYPWMRGLVGKYKHELRAVADSRHEGVTVVKWYKDYCRKTEEKIAEFISLYLTNRPQLQKLAPSAMAEFEARIKKDDYLKRLIDIKPSNVEEFESHYENNYVLDKSIPRDEDVISLRRGGKMTHYRVPLEMAMAVKNLHPVQVPAWLRLALLTPILRRGAVGYNLSFIVPNVARDQFDAAFNAGKIPFTSFWAGAKHFIAKDDVYKMYMERGGGMDSIEAGTRRVKKGSTEMVYGGSLGKYFDTEYWKMNGVMKTALMFPGYILKSPFRGIQYLAEVSEMSTRLGLFQSERKRGSVDRAIHIARQSTIDFQRIGYNGRIPNEIIPFLNAAIQGTDRMIRTWRDHPARALGYVGMVWLTYLGLYAWNKEKRKYKEISGQEKANNWIVMYDDENYLKIPKGHVQKWLLNPLQYIIEIVEGQTTMKGWEAALQFVTDASPVGAGTVPIPVKMILEPIANYDYYWQQEIIKPNLQGLPPKYQYDKRTPEILKEIGKALNISPAMMHHELRTLFAGGGQNVLWAIDYALGKAGVTKPVGFDASRAAITRRFYGKAEEWKSDLAARKRILYKRQSEIRKRARRSPRDLIEYYGFSRGEARKAIKAANDEMKKIRKKLNQINSAERAIGGL